MHYCMWTACNVLCSIYFESFPFFPHQGLIDTEGERGSPGIFHPPPPPLASLSKPRPYMHVFMHPPNKHNIVAIKEIMQGRSQAIRRVGSLHTKSGPSFVLLW